MTTLDHQFTKNAEVVFSEIDGELVMLHGESGKYYSVNAVGKATWELLDGERTAGDVVDALMERFEVDRQTCEAHVLAFLELLAGHELIIRS